MRLVDALRSLDAVRFEELLARRAVTVDESRKTSIIDQAARALAHPPELEAQPRWSPELRAAASSLAVRGGGVHRRDLGEALPELLRRDLVLVDDSGCVHMPGAYRVQVASSPLDPPRRIRVLLNSVSDPELRDIEKSHVGRRTTLPRVLVADELLHRFENPDEVASCIRGLSPEGRRLLRAIEVRGGELATHEIQGLSRDPRRYVATAGARLSPSSQAYELVRMGFLVPTKPGIYTLPEEVGAVVGRKRRSAARAETASVLERVECEDLAPARARLAREAGPLAISLLALLRRGGVTLKADAGAPRSRLKRAGDLLGLSERESEILVAIARSADLSHDGGPVDHAANRLFDTWLRGAGWDEGRDPEDPFRAGPRLAHVRSGIEGLRPTVVALLRSLPPRRFALRDELIDIVENDPLKRTSELARAEALRRSPEAFRRSIRQSLTRVFDEVLPTLGMVDRGEGDRGTVVRLSARGRAVVEGVASAGEGKRRTDCRGSWVRPQTFRLPSTARVSEAIAFGALGTLIPDASGSVLHLTLEKSAMQRSHRRAISLRSLRRRLDGQSDGLPEVVVELFESTTLIKVGFLPAAGYLPLEGSLRDRLLRADPEGRVFRRDSPVGGLLVAQNASHASLEALLREVGAVLDTP